MFRVFLFFHVLFYEIFGENAYLLSCYELDEILIPLSDCKCLVDKHLQKTGNRRKKPAWLCPKVTKFSSPAPLKVTNQYVISGLFNPCS